MADSENQKPKLKTVPLSDNVTNIENSDNPAKRRKTGEGRGRTKTPQAVAVARRNARERNRVKQVNNGFAALRQHIPDEIAEIFEKGSPKPASVAAAKKLSKVETLRMAVEYIRHLEEMLNNESANSSTDSYMPATPPPEQGGSCFYAIKPRFSEERAETQIAIINGQQYVRIPGTNTFQLLIQEENEENVKPDFSILPAGTIIHPEVKPEIKQEHAFIALPGMLQIKTEEIQDFHDSMAELEDGLSDLHDSFVFCSDNSSDQHWDRIVEAQ